MVVWWTSGLARMSVAVGGADRRRIGCGTVFGLSLKNQLMVHITIELTMAVQINNIKVNFWMKMGSCILLSMAIDVKFQCICMCANRFAM
jgi:hypothetical protein